MKRIAQGIMLLAVAVSVAGAEDEEQPVRRARRPLPYDRAVEFHDFKPGVAVPEDEDEGEDRPAFSLESLLPGLYGHTVVVDPGFSLDHTLTPPSMPAAPAPDDERKDWLVPVVERALRGEEAQERPASTGWGWLADEAGALRRSQAEEAEAVQREEEAEMVSAEETVRADELVLPEVLRPQVSLFDRAEEPDPQAQRLAERAPPQREELSRDELSALLAAYEQDGGGAPFGGQADAVSPPVNAYRGAMDSPFGRGGFDQADGLVPIGPPDFSFRDRVEAVAPDGGLQAGSHGWGTGAAAVADGDFFSSAPVGAVGFEPVDIPGAGWDGGWSGGVETGGIGLDTPEDRPVDRVITPTHSDDWLSSNPGW
jgi:hypothetical protein